MFSFDDHSIKIEFKLVAAVTECYCYSPSDFVQDICGQILVRHEGEEKRHDAGYVDASLVQIGSALEEGISASANSNLREIRGL